MKERCMNMNHGRSNAPIKFCPTCGEVVNRTASARCDTHKHASLRKDRHSFCHDCGVRIAQR